LTERELASTLRWHTCSLRCRPSGILFRGGCSRGFFPECSSTRARPWNMRHGSSYNPRRSDHVTDALVSLHWLRVQERIQFKIAVLTYRVLHSDAPQYLSRSPLLLMSLVDGHCVLPQPIGWLCLQLDCPPSVAELFRLPPLKSGTLYRNTSSQLPRCSPSGVTLKRFYYNSRSACRTAVDLVFASVIYATLKNHWLIDWIKGCW